MKMSLNILHHARHTRGDAKMAATAPAMTPEQQAQYTALAMKLQRDVNCVSDPERSVRRRALDKLQRTLSAEAPTTPPAVLATLFRTNLKDALLACAGQDAVEKCREKALTLVLLFTTQRAVELSQPMLRDIVALLSARIGKLPYPEPTEEIRLLLLQLTHAYLTQLGAAAASTTTADLSLTAVIADLANVLGKTALDPFPDVKKLSADCAIVVSRAWPADVALQLGAIVKPMVTNLGHQHSRVRVGALQVRPCQPTTRLPTLY